MDHTTTGTPAYMAPEIILGDADVDRRADVYALGCVAYFLLTGQLVFEADTPMKMLMQHVHAQAGAAVAADRAADPARARRARARRASRRTRQPAAERRGAVPDGGGLQDLRDAGTRRAPGRWWQTHLPDLTGPLTLERIGRRRHRARRTAQSQPRYNIALHMPKKSVLDRALSLFTDVRAGEGRQRAAARRERLLPAGVLFGAEDRARRADPQRGGRRRRELRLGRPGAAAAGVRAGVRRIRVAREPRLADLRRHAVLRVAPADFLRCSASPACASASPSISGSASSTWRRWRSSGRLPTISTTPSAASGCFR